MFFSSCSTPKQEWTLVWEDNFDGVAVDTTFWNFEDNARGGGNAEMQYYTPRNVTVGKHPETGESCLVITARKEQYNGRPATSARVNTHNKVAVQYGKVEARIAFPYTKDGLWPAFWMLGNNLASNLGNNDDVDAQKEQLELSGRTVWPKSGEIDIVEMGHKNGIEAGTQDRYFNGACHWGEDFNSGQYRFAANNVTADYSVQGGFHLFTLLWTPDSISMYLDQDRYPDAQPYFALSLADKDINEPGHYFDHPFYVVLNLGVGGFFPDMPMPEKYPELVTDQDPNFQRITALPADGTPVSMYVDYVRIWQKGENYEQLIVP
ncbi:MAG: glycoside hydrolase family 16 protein [Bacteroidales bacterium]|nr:glycoside hydrolase family 16 protein [Bacteroidales bacterium]